MVFLRVLLGLNLGILVDLILIVLLVCGLWFECVVCLVMLKVLKFISDIVLFFFSVVLMLLMMVLSVWFVVVLEMLVCLVMCLINLDLFICVFNDDLVDCCDLYLWLRCKIVM